MHCNCIGARMYDVSSSSERSRSCDVPPDPNPAIEPGFQISVMSDYLLILKFNGGLYGTEIVL